MKTAVEPLSEDASQDMGSDADWIKPYLAS